MFSRASALSDVIAAISSSFSLDESDPLLAFLRASKRSLSSSPRRLRCASRTGFRGRYE